MPHEETALTVAYAPALLPSYEAARHAVIARSKRTLAERVAAQGGSLLPLDPIVTRADAERAAASALAGGADVVVLQCATFAMGDVSLPFAEAGLRLALWAPSEPRRSGPIPLNGLVAMHLHAGILRRHGGPPFAWLFGDAGVRTFDERLARLLAAVRIARRLADARIGLVGGVASTFTPMACDEAELARRTGATVVAIDLAEVLEAASRERDRPSDPQRERADEARVRTLTQGRVEIGSDALRANLAVYRTLADLARARDLSALAVRDWPEFQDHMGLHPGLAFSLVDEFEGVSVAAEGDVGGALSMLALRAAGAHAPTLMDVVDHDPDRDALLAWHCGGGALGLADAAGVRVTRHTTLARGDAPEVGAVADLALRPGPVTLLRIGRDGALWFVADADVVASPHPGFDGTRGWISNFATDHGPRASTDVLATLLGDGVEHHVALAGGHHAAALRATAAWLGGHLEPIRRDLGGEGSPPEEVS